MPDPPAGAPPSTLTSSTAAVVPSPRPGPGRGRGTPTRPRPTPPARSSTRAPTAAGRASGRPRRSVVGEHQHHQPPVAVAHDLGVAERGRADVEHRVAGVRRPRTAAVGAPRERLALAEADRVEAGVQRHERPGAVAPEAGGVPGVVDDAARPHVLRLGRRQGDRQLGPVEQVVAHRVAPRHRAVHDRVGPVLEEQVALAVVDDQAVGVVEPAAARGEVVARAARRDRSSRRPSLGPTPVTGRPRADILLA